MLSALVVELVLSAGFLLVIHGATDKFAPAGFAPIAIGLALTLIHLISIPVTNTSVNPARSTAVAIFQGGWALEQLWFFLVVPIVGGIIGGLMYRTLLEKREYVTQKAWRNVRPFFKMLLYVDSSSCCAPFMS